MTRTILFTLVWCLTTSLGWAQEQPAPQTPAEVKTDAAAASAVYENQITVEFHPRTGEDPLAVIAFHNQLKAACDCEIHMRYRDDVEVGQLILVARTPQEVAYREQLIPKIQHFQASGISVLEFSLLTADKDSTPNGIDPSAKAVPAAIHPLLIEEMARFGGNWRITGAPLSHPTDGIWEFQPQGSHLYLAWISGEHQLFGTVRLDTRKSPASLALTLSNPCRQFQVRDVQLQASIQWNQGEEQQQGTSPQQLQLKFLFPEFDDPTSLTLQRIGTEPNNPAAESEHEEFKSRIQQLRSKQEAQLRADLDLRIARHAYLAKTEPATSSKLTRMASDIQDRERALQELTKTVPFDWRERETAKFVGSWIITKSAEELGGFRGRLTIREDQSALVIHSNDDALKLGLNDARLSLVRWEGLNRAALELGSGSVKTVVPVTYGWHGNQAKESQPDQMTWSLALDGEYAKSDRENKPGYDKIYFRRVAQDDIGKAPDNSVQKTQQAIILVIDPVAKQSEVVKQVVEALEKAGIGKAETEQSATKAESDDLSIVLQVRRDVAYQDLIRLVELLKSAGVTRLAFTTTGSEENVVQIRAGADTPNDAVKTIVEGLNTFQDAGKSPLKFTVKVSQIVHEADTVVPFEEPDSSALSKKSQSEPPESIADSREDNQQLALAIAAAMKQVGIMGKDIQIEVRDGVCSLTGQWRNPDDHIRAEKLALSIPGITSVQHEPLARKSPKPASDISSIKVFTLKHAQATEVAEVLKQVYDKGPSKIVPDARTNSVIVTGPEGQVQEIEALLLKLDETGNSPASPARRMRTYRVKVGDTLSGIANRELGSSDYHAIIEANRHVLKSRDSLQPGMELMIPTPLRSLETEAAKLVVQLEDELAQLQQSVGANHPKVKELQARIAAARQNERSATPATASRSPGSLPTNVNLSAENEHQEVQQQITQLRKEYEAADSEARQLARQLQTTPDGAQKNETQKADLRRAVQRAFTARQSLLRAELMEMQSRLLQTQRSIEMRERISDQIIQRRVEDLLNPQLEWDGNTPVGPPLSKAADAKPTDTSRVLVALKDIRPGERLVEGKNASFKEFPQSALVTYNGDLVHSPDEFAVRVAATIPYVAGDLIRKTRLTEKGQYGSGSSQIPRGLRVFTFSSNDPHTHAGLLRPGDRVDVTVTFADRKGNMVTKVLLECIEVFATEESQNEQRPRSVSLLVTPEQDGFVKIAQSKGQLALSLRHPDDAEVKNLNGINSAIMEEMRRSIGEDELPRPSGDDETRWRSAVVEILVSGKSDVADNGARKVGFGIIVAADGTMLSQMGGGWSSIIRDWPNIDAQFDDGSIVPLQIVDEGGSGFVVLRPKQSVNLNHHFPLSGTTTTVGDEVYVGQMVVTSLEKNIYGMSATAVKLSQTERRVATLVGLPVWQLTPPERIPNSFCYPVLNKDGEFLAITLADTGGLTLAVPVEKLREILPQSLGKLLTVPAATQKAGPAAFMEKVQDILSENAGELPTVPANRTSAPQPAKGAEAPTDPKAAMLAKLQGVWDVEVQSEDVPKEKPPFKIIAEIRDNVMTWSLDPPQPDNDKPPVFQIKLGEPGTPQPVDLVAGPNDGEDQRAVLPGIMEVGQDLVRICVNVNSAGTRPEVLVAGKNVDIYNLRRLPKQSRTPQPAAKPEPDSSQAAMLAKLQGKWHLTIHPASTLGMGLFLKDSEEAEAVIEGQVLKVFYKKSLGANLLEDTRDPFLAYTVKVTFGDTGSPQPVDLLFGPNEEPVNRRLALGIADFSDDVIRLCFDRATESESIRPEVFTVGAKGEVWELRREPPTGSRAHALDRLRGLWEGEVTSEKLIDGKSQTVISSSVVEIRGADMKWSVLPEENLEFRLGTPGTPQPFDLFVTRNGKVHDEWQGILDVSQDRISMCVGDVGEENRPRSFADLNEGCARWKLTRPLSAAALKLGISVDANVVPPQEVMGVELRGGLRIEKVFAGTPAAQGGMQPGDILVGMHVWEMTKLEDLQYPLGQSLKGEVSFHVLRGGHVRKGNVLLDGSKRPASDAGLTPDQLTKISVEVDRGIATLVTTQLDPLLEKLQGAWDMHMNTADPFQPGGQKDVVIQNDLMTITSAFDVNDINNTDIPVQLKPGPAGSPQPIDLIYFPNDRKNRMEFLGIIELVDDTVRICMSNSSDPNRPTAFAAGKDASLWELRRQPAVHQVSELEGDWHLESATDTTGKPREIKPDNWTIRGH